MSQQQQMPEPQDQRESDVTGQAREARYYARRSSKQANEPKEEHPATFEEEVPPYSYPAQDRVTYTREESQQEERQSTGFAGHSSKQDQSHSIPYSRIQQPFPVIRVRGSAGRKFFTILGLILLGILLIKVIPLLLVLVVGIIGVSLLVILLPVLIILGIVVGLAILALIVMAMLGIPLHRSGSNVRRGRPWI